MIFTQKTGKMTIFEPLEIRRKMADFYTTDRTPKNDHFFDPFPDLKREMVFSHF